ncbi:vWA domain-containing protein [Actinophytocola sp.]|uniref:vWA domain-containing protein n=1 Tax=Actinophytocola sp. TaxID=1872138 RepID=UPI002D7EE989|nr:vWA domain-containing protein [Actinophytocola sp.]HET9143472.1 vWA domain-containing protein [Actinophytocola sp.]
MTRPDLTRIYFLLDRSGSMESIRTDTEGGFAAFVEEQRKAPGHCQVTLAQFDHRYDVVYSGVPVADIPPLVLKPRGRTALLDAMGTLITDAGEELAALPENDRPGNVIVAVMTDGHENASREWTHSAIRALVERQTTTYSWQVLYMGADQDAIEVGSRLGVNRDFAVTYGRGKAKEALHSAAGKVSGYRAARMADPAARMAGYTAEERSDLAD